MCHPDRSAAKWSDLLCADGKLLLTALYSAYDAARVDASPEMWLGSE